MAIDEEDTEMDDQSGSKPKANQLEIANTEKPAENTTTISERVQKPSDQNDVS